MGYGQWFINGWLISVQVMNGILILNGFTYSHSYVLLLYPLSFNAGKKSSQEVKYDMSKIGKIKFLVSAIPSKKHKWFHVFKQAYAFLKTNSNDEISSSSAHPFFPTEPSGG